VAFRGLRCALLKPDSRVISAVRDSRNATEGVPYRAFASER